MIAWNSRSTLGFGTLCALLLTGCATTELISTWKSPSYHGQPRKIMVIAITKRPLNERLIEDEFVRQLRARGTNGVASYTVMSDVKQGDRAIVAAKMKEHGADAVLISRLMKKKIVRSFVVNPPYYSNWPDYYGFGFQAVYDPKYTFEDQYAVMEANLYDTGDEKLIWSATSETEIQGSSESQIKSYIVAMVNAMARKKLLRQE